MRAASLAVAAVLYVRSTPARADCAGEPDPNNLIGQLTAAPYLRLIRPDSEGPPTQVATQLYVETFDALDEMGGTISLSGYWRVAWTDPRLNFTSVDGGGCFDKLPLPLQGNGQKPLTSQEVWVPDLYFSTAQDEFFGSYLFDLYPDGSLYMSVRFKHTFSCTFDFDWMPFDTQACTISLMSYTEDASQVLLAAKDGIAIDFPPANEVRLPAWRLTSTGHRYEMARYGTGDNVQHWHEMKLDLVIERFAGYHLMNDVFYAILFVAMSWSGFFVDRSNAPARVALSLLPVLTMLNHIRGIQQSLPRAPNMIWLNFFLFVSLIFNILAVLEYGVVSSLLGQEKRRTERLHVLRELSKHLGQAHSIQSSKRLSGRLTSTTRSAKSSPDQEALPSRSGPALDDIPSAEEADEVERLQRCDSSFADELDEADLLPMQKRMVEDSMKLFDPESDGFVTRAELRDGLRRFNIYYTAEQVSELFGKFGVEENEGMPRGKFLMYLKEMPEATPTMYGGFRDQPPSMIVDKTFRYGFFLIYVVVIGILFCVTAEQV